MLHPQMISPYSLTPTASYADLLNMEMHAPCKVHLLISALSHLKVHDRMVYMVRQVTFTCRQLSLQNHLCLVSYYSYSQYPPPAAAAGASLPGVGPGFQDNHHADVLQGHAPGRVHLSRLQQPPPPNNHQQGRKGHLRLLPGASIKR